MSLSKRVLAEVFGTFWLVFGGCGAAVLAGGTISWVGVSFAFGLTVLTMAYAIGHVSGCHLNPAVTLGLAAGGRFDWRDVVPYWIAQVIGASVAAGLLYLIISQHADFSLTEGPVGKGFAANGFDEHSPGGYPMMSALMGEIALTFMFLFIIMGSTDKRAPAGFAPIAIGLGLTLIHLIGIPLDNLSVNPARSTGPALFVGGWALSQLWLFWVAPLIGGGVAGIAYKFLFEED